MNPPTWTGWTAGRRGAGRLAAPRPGGARWPSAWGPSPHARSSDVAAGRVSAVRRVNGNTDAVVVLEGAQRTHPPSLSANSTCRSSGSPIDADRVGPGERPVVDEDRLTREADRRLGRQPLAVDRDGLGTGLPQAVDDDLEVLGEDLALVLALGLGARVAVGAAVAAARGVVELTVIPGPVTACGARRPGSAPRAASAARTRPARRAPGPGAVSTSACSGVQLRRPAGRPRPRRASIWLTRSALALTGAVDGRAQRQRAEGQQQPGHDRRDERPSTVRVPVARRQPGGLALGRRSGIPGVEGSLHHRDEQGHRLVGAPPRCGWPAAGVAARRGSGVIAGRHASCGDHLAGLHDVHGPGDPVEDGPPPREGPADRQRPLGEGARCPSPSSSSGKA